MGKDIVILKIKHFFPQKMFNGIWENYGLIYNIAENKCRKIINYFAYNPPALALLYNIIIAEKQRLINYFEIMSALTMYCPPEIDQYSANASCLSVSSGHYIVLVDIISNK